MKMKKLAQRCIELGAQDFLLKDEVNSRILTRAIRYAKQRSSMALALRNSHQKTKKSWPSTTRSLSWLIAMVLNCVLIERLQGRNAVTIIWLLSY